MRSFFVAALTALLFSTSAVANDHQVMSFTGVHLGIGAQWYKNDGAVAEGEEAVPPAQLPNLNCDGIFGFLCSDEAFRVDGSDENGFTVVASLLAQRQLGGFVIGSEIGGEFGKDLRGGFAMLRFGLAMGNVMPYVHAGAGYEIAESEVDGFKLDDGRVTGRAGVGAMVLVTKDFSVDGNYTYVAGGDLRDRAADGTEVEAGDGGHRVMVFGRVKLN